MTTFNQRRRKIRRPQSNFCASPALRQCPQRRGRIFRLIVKSPRKPNSARRKAAKIKLTTGRFIIAKISGSGYTPTKYAIVLIRGKGFKDTPNAKYTIIRGALECIPLFNRNSKRSRYGVKKEN
jgi:small subunit ribosomal protein S12